MRVALVALGASSWDYIRLAEGLGNKASFFDEIWAVNSYGSVLQCDRMFHMDDVRIQQIRADGGNKKIAAMLEWMKTAAGPIYTSRPHPDYPGLVAYPLEDVLNVIKRPYINNTVAAAICFAIALKEPEPVTELACFGVDFSYSDMRKAERGRACCEHWLGVANERGIKIHIPKSSSLMDTCEPPQIYGYDTLDLLIKRENGKVKVTCTERTELPTAQQIEAAYHQDLDEHGRLTERQDESANGAGSKDIGDDHEGGRDNRASGNGLALAQESVETPMAGN